MALALAALIALPGWQTLAAFALISLLRAGLHDSCARSLRGRGYSLLCLGAVLSDLLVATAWAAAFTRSEIDWRGNRLRVCAGTRLEAVACARPQLRTAGRSGEGFATSAAGGGFAGDSAFSPARVATALFTPRMTS